EDRIQKETIEAKNALENYLYAIKSQVADEKQLGGKLEAEDKDSILEAIKEKLDWLDENGSTASKEDFEEQKAEVEAIVNPITSKLYGRGGDADSSNDDEDEEKDEDEDDEIEH